MGRISAAPKVLPPGPTCPAASDNQRMSLAASPLRSGDGAAHPVTVTSPPLFGAAARSHLVERDPQPPVERGPFWWPLTLVVAPAGAAVLVP